MMIPIDKDVAVQQMLMSGTPVPQIAKEAKVSETTVRRVNRALKLADTISKRKRVRVKLLTVEGLPARAIASRLAIPISAVNAIRRTDFLRARYTEESPHPCPSCGHAVLPKEGIEHESSDAPGCISQEHARELFDLCDSVVGLSKAHLVTSLLFYDIADRAEALIADIIREDYVEEETHY